MIDRSQVDLVKQVADLRVIAAQFITVKKAPSGKVIACCCFHKEHTPSLTIWKNRYVCFGCNLRGDTFTFVSRIKTCSFTDAVKFVADLYGIELTERHVSRAHAALVAEAQAHCEWWWLDQRRRVERLKAEAYAAEDWDWLETVAGLECRINAMDARQRYGIFRAADPPRSAWRRSVSEDAHFAAVFAKVLDISFSG